MDRTWIDHYIAGADELKQAIRGLSLTERNAFPVPGTWSIQQIVMHMMDSDLIAADRMKRVIAEDHPTLIGYNETRFAQRLLYDELDAETACEIFAMNRRMMGEILKRQPDAAFQRTGHHNETGEITLEYLVKTYAGHLDHHMKFVKHKRELLGKPLA
ncbi:MAG TPA: DinB family protein [Pirellulales bacterium]|nr:DinB family protein [Pirellulales bacterium]